MPLFIAAFFTTAKREKQPKCLSMHEQLNKLWYIHTVEYYSSIKSNKLLVTVVTWMILKNTSQS